MSASDNEEIQTSTVSAEDNLSTESAGEVEKHKMNFTEKRKRVRDRTDEENKIIEQLEQLEPWKQFADSEYFKKVPNLELDFDKPCFGVTGRLKTDEMHYRFDGIPKILEFFREGGAASEYQAQGLSALDIFVIFNYNFIGNEENSTRKRDNTGRDFHRDEHVALPDIEAALKKAPKLLDNKRHYNTYVLPEVLQKRLLGQLAKSFKTVTETIESYEVPIGDQQTLKTKNLTDRKTLLCRNKYCGEYYMSLSMNCCNGRPLCLKCAVSMANEKAVKWLFEPVMVRCHEKCGNGLDYPINSQQVTAKRVYSNAYKQLSVCKDCLRAYNKDDLIPHLSEHICSRDDLRLIGKAISPGDPKWIIKPNEDDENTSITSNCPDGQLKAVKKIKKSCPLKTSKTVSKQRANTVEQNTTVEPSTNTIDEIDSNSIVVDDDDRPQSSVDIEDQTSANNQENVNQSNGSNAMEVVEEDNGLQLEDQNPMEVVEEDNGLQLEDQNSMEVVEEDNGLQLNDPNALEVVTQNNNQQLDDNDVENTQSTDLSSSSNRDPIGTQETLKKKTYLEKKEIAHKVNGLPKFLSNQMDKLVAKENNLKQKLEKQNQTIIDLQKKMDAEKRENDEILKKLSEDNEKKEMYEFAKKISAHQTEYMTTNGFKKVFEDTFPKEIN